MLERSITLKWVDRLRGINYLSLKIFLYLKWYQAFLYLKKSLVCHKPNLFRCIYDFLVGTKQSLIFNGEQVTNYGQTLIRTTLPTINKTQCPNNISLWQFCDKTLLYKPSQNSYKGVYITL